MRHRSSAGFLPRGSSGSAAELIPLWGSFAKSSSTSQRVSRFHGICLMCLPRFSLLSYNNQYHTADSLEIIADGTLSIKMGGNKSYILSMLKAHDAALFKIA